MGLEPFERLRENARLRLPGNAQRERCVFTKPFKLSNPIALLSQLLGSGIYLQEVYEFAIDVQLFDASVEAGGVPEVPMVERVCPDLGWNAGDEHGAAALL